jgi:asparagine synthetase B (glutamine-hydrolysing)
MTHIVRYRGPDGEVLHIAPGLGLGYRRLAVTDPAAGHGGAHSFFSRIRKPLPGQYLITDGERTETHRYWDLPTTAEGDMRRDAVAVQEEPAHLLGHAVRISMRSDVPLGAFLSGGLDSASVVT